MVLLSKFMDWAWNYARLMFLPISFHLSSLHLLTALHWLLLLTVCKWLGYYLCMRDTPKTDAIHQDGPMFDAVIVWKGIFVSSVHSSICLLRPCVCQFVLTILFSGCVLQVCRPYYKIKKIMQNYFNKFKYYNKLIFWGAVVAWKM